MTDAQKKALKWLTERGGDGVFDMNGVLIAEGEAAPFMRSTWNRLRDLGLIEFYNPLGRGRGRARVVGEAKRKLGGEE